MKACTIMVQNSERVTYNAWQESQTQEQVPLQVGYPSK